VASEALLVKRIRYFVRIRTTWEGVRPCPHPQKCLDLLCARALYEKH